MKKESPKILIATQGPNRDPFKKEIEILFKTLNLFGGKLSNVQKIVCFTEQPDPILSQKLKSLGVKIKLIEGIDSRSPHSNKIRMLNLEQTEDFDVLIALDADILILKDFSEFIDLEFFRAKPVDNDPISIKNWKKVYEYFDVRFPNERYITSFQNKQTIPYFNSGVLIIPKKYIPSLYETWKNFAQKLLNSYDQLPEIKQFSFFTDQIALSLALAELKISVNPLPLEMNFPTHYNIHESFRPENSSPFLIHYHHFSESGIINHCNYEKINKIIDKINQTIIKETRLKDKPITHSEISITNILKKLSLGKKRKKEFDNYEFWEHRYRTNIELGSGIGSRGEHLEYKKKIILEIIEKYNPASFLDVGCGDLEVIKSLKIKNYMGIDFSETIINRNTELKPEWNFLSGNFLDLSKNKKLQSDMVICLDVLIHQHHYKEYFQFVKALVDSCKKVCLIAAFNDEPRKEFTSEITSYHEPITKTLKKLNIDNYQILGNYRDTTLLFFEK